MLTLNPQINHDRLTHVAFEVIASKKLSDVVDTQDAIRTVAATDDISAFSDSEIIAVVNKIEGAIK